MYLTVEEVKESGISALKDLDDEFIEKRIEVLSGVIDEYCNTRFEPTEIEWTTDLRIRVKTLKKPLLSVEELKILDDPLEENEDYYVYPEKNLIEFEDILDYKRRKKVLYIKYFYGHEEVPAIVKEVLLELLKDSVVSSDTTSRMKSETWEDYSYTLSDTSETRASILSMLDKFIEDSTEYIESSSNKIRATLL